MIATSKKSSSTRTISRQYQFSRLQEHTIACAYEKLIPIVFRRTTSLPHQHAAIETVRTKTNSRQSSVAGA
jgi:hypothetical protein